MKIPAALTLESALLKNKLFLNIFEIYIIF